MKTPSGDLFHLVKSLNMNEKRYFKVYIHRYTKERAHNCVMLFDSLDKQKEFDENPIREKLSLQPGELGQLKIFLHQNIIKSLVAFNSKTASVSAQIRELSDEIEILFNKSLYRQCLKKLEKAKALAYTYEKYALLFEIMKWDRKLAAAGFVKTKMRQSFSMIYEEEKNILKKLLNVHEYGELADRLGSYWVTDDDVRNTKKMREMKEIMKNPLLRNEKMALTTSAKLSYHYALGMNAMTNEDGAESYKHLNNIVKYLEQFPWRIEENPSGYISDLHNFMITCFQLKKKG